MRLSKLVLAACLLAGPAFAAPKAVPVPPARPAPQVLWDPLHLFSPGTTPQTNPVTALQQFTVADLQAALADAQAQTPPDTTAANCYTALIPIVQTNVKNPLPSGMGGFQAFQKARDLITNASQIQSSFTGGALNTACAPLVLSAQNTILMLATQVGVKIAMPAIPGIPVIP